MSELEKSREQYLKDSLPACLNRITENLARICVLSSDSEAQTEVHRVIYESKYFIEWTAPEIMRTAPKVDTETIFEMVNIQRKLVRWQFHLDEIWIDDGKRLEVGAEAGLLSDWMSAKFNSLNQ
mgnify:CR=1 FL=1